MDGIWSLVIVVGLARMMGAPNREVAARFTDHKAAVTHLASSDPWLASADVEGGRAVVSGFVCFCATVHSYTSPTTLVVEVGALLSVALCLVVFDLGCGRSHREGCRQLPCLPRDRTEDWC